MIQTDEVEKIGHIRSDIQIKKQFEEDKKAYKWHTDSYLRGWRHKKHPMFRLKDEAPYRLKELIDMDPHRIQVFSFEEIWRGVIKRLVALNIMKDPEEAAKIRAADLEEVSSDEYEEHNFNFIKSATDRSGRLLAGKIEGPGGIKQSLKDSMRINDFIMLNKMLDLTNEHEQYVRKLRYMDGREDKKAKGIFAFVQRTLNTLKDL